jgi:ATP-dependent RNA helicase DeaD
MSDSVSREDDSILIEPENSLPEATINDLPEWMREAALGMGWKSLMPVQAKGIPYLMAGRDMIVQSRTGSGKTGAFLIPLLLQINQNHAYPQALALVPTRELALQVYKEFEALTRGTEIRGALVYGGVGYGAQMKALKEGAQIIIGTPGRVLDLIGRRALMVDRLRTLVLDEADEMLSMGFYPAMRELREYLPRQRSSWMFSATMAYKVQTLAREFLHDPEFLSLSAGSVTVSTMEHRFYDAPPLEKDLCLMRLIEMENPESAIIFCNMKSGVEYLSTVLKNYGYNADQITGDLQQKDRERVMNGIKQGSVRFLVATDIAARGIDISDLSHVIQYDVPKDPESYIHRAGRTARAGNTGLVLTLVSDMSEKSDLNKIARKFGVEFVEMPMPTQEEVEQRVAERMTILLEGRFRNTTTRLQRERIKRFEPLVRSLAESDDERSILAMLLDDIYHQEFHAGSPKARLPHEAPEPPRSPAKPQQKARTPEPDQGQEPAGDQEEKQKRKRKRGGRRRNKGGGAEGESEGGVAGEGGSEGNEGDAD